MTGWDLPEAVEVGGRRYPIHADYRDILEIVEHLTCPEEGQVHLYVAMALFYEGFDQMPPACYREAAKEMLAFIACGEPEEHTPGPKTIDWKQDRNLIISDVNRVAGQEVRAMPFCHWWTFISWFNGIGDGPLATVVSIREKLRRGKPLSEWERDFYRKNREKVDFKRTYTAQEDAVLQTWLGK